MSWDVSYFVNFKLIFWECMVLQTLWFTLGIFKNFIFNIYTMSYGDFHGEPCFREAYNCCTHIFISTLVTGLLPILPAFTYGRDREGLGAFQVVETSI